MKFERITRSGIVVDGSDPGSDPRLTVADIAWSLGSVRRWGGHHPDHVTIAMHSVAMARNAETLLDQFACLWHDAAEVFVGDCATTLKQQPEMAWYRDLDAKVLASLVRRFAPELEDFAWYRIKPLDSASLVIESQRYPETEDRRDHVPFRRATLEMRWRDYDPRDDHEHWTKAHYAIQHALRCGYTQPFRGF